MNAVATSIAETRSHNVPPDTFRRHYREIRDAKDQHHDTGMAVARAKKAAKADGIDLDALKMIEQLAKLDQDVVELLLRNVGLYAGWLELPIGTQANLFGPPETGNGKDPKHIEWEATNAGILAGTKGEERNTNRHKAGTLEFAAWDKGWLRGNKDWLKGQEKIAKQMGPATAAKGRKRANGASARAH